MIICDYLRLFVIICDYSVIISKLYDLNLDLIVNKSRINIA